jgi:spermidine/putrescine transport system permease protein
MTDLAASSGGRRALKVFYVLLLIFLYAPIAILLIFSFNNSSVPTFPLVGFTTRWYGEFIHNGDLIQALRTSAEVAGLASVVAVVLGLLAAVVLVRRRIYARSALSALLLSPLVIPYIVFGISLLMFFHAAGVSLGVQTIVVGHVVLAIPYTILVLTPRLERIDVHLEEAARDLGAGALRTFRSITLPLLAPAVASALIVAFTLSFDEFAVAQFVNGNVTTFPIYLYSQLRFPTRLPQAIAVATVVMAISLMLVLSAEIGRRLLERRLEGTAR